MSGLQVSSGCDNISDAACIGRASQQNQRPFHVIRRVLPSPAGGSDAARLEAINGGVRGLSRVQHGYAVGRISVLYQQVNASRLRNRTCHLMQWDRDSRFRFNQLSWLTCRLSGCGRWNAFRQGAEDDSPQLQQQFLFPGGKLRFGGKCHFGIRHEIVVDPRVDLIPGQVCIGGKDSQFGRRDREGLLPPLSRNQINLAIGNRAGVTLQVNIDEPINGLPQIAAIGMAPYTDDGIHLVAGSVETIEPFQLIDHAVVGVHREDAVLITVDEQHGARSDQPGDSNPRPVERVVEKHAVAMTVNDAIGNIGQQVGHTADRDRHFDSFIGRCDPDGGRTAAADARDGDPVRVDVGTTDQIVDPANSVPAFDSRRCISARMPPPAILAIGSMMDSCNLP